VIVPGFAASKRRARFPKRLKERFGARRWIDADDRALLDYENAQIALVGAGADHVEEELDIRIDEEEDQRSRYERHMATSRPPRAPSAADVERGLAGVDFPASKRDLVGHASTRVPGEPAVLELIQSLPARRYRDAAEVAVAIGERKSGRRPRNARQAPAAEPPTGEAGVTAYGDPGFAALSGFALAEVSGECSPRLETEGAEGGGVCPAYALVPVGSPAGDLAVHVLPVQGGRGLAAYTLLYRARRWRDHSSSRSSWRLIFCSPDVAR
jgi:hypothetical protein